VKNEGAFIIIFVEQRRLELGQVKRRR